MAKTESALTRRVLRNAVCVAVAWAAASARADVKLASVFGDGMVVQRDRPVRVWGTARPNATVSVRLGEDRATTKSGDNGRFVAGLPARPAGGPFTLEASDGSDAASVRDVLLGDVWLCSGQSNMQLSLAEADAGKATAADAAKHATLRLCKIGQAWTDTPQTACKAEWKSASPESALKFTAVGYFFGDALLRSPPLSNVPVGLIESDLGGTLAEAWTPQEELATIEGKPGDSMFGIKPATLYNGMIAPLGPMGIKGVLWYQGEGNAADPAAYPSKLTAMIRGWRKQFGDPKLPFLIVQLPDYAPSWGGYYWQWLRDAQRQVADTVDDVGLVTAINTNDGLDLHPKAKQAIGRRAALLARMRVYGEKIVGRGPVFKTCEIGGGSVRVVFDAAGGTLAASDPHDVRGFMVAGYDGKYRRATGTIDGDGVVVRSDLVASPKSVRYAWAGVPDATLTNADGLPGYPFRTDALPMDSAGTRPQAAARVVGNKTLEITFLDGRIIGLTVKGKQFLSNETGVNMGVNMTTFFGPSGFGTLTELGPDLVRLGGEKFNLQIQIEQTGCTWTVRSDENDARTIRVNLSPVIKASGPDGGTVTLTRPGATIKVAGVDKVEAGDGLPFLEIKARPHAATTVRFDIEGGQ